MLRREGHDQVSMAAPVLHELRWTVSVALLDAQVDAVEGQDE
jgi:hypothetical protein